MSRSLSLGRPLRLLFGSGLALERFSDIPLDAIRPGSSPSGNRHNAQVRE